jgi:ferredoxin
VKPHEAAADSGESGERPRLAVDLRLCGGHARCIQEAPEVFRVDDVTNQASVIPTADLSAYRAGIELAILTCPERAIHWGKE